MHEEAEPRDQQKAADARDGDPLTVLHGYAATAMSVRGVA